MKAKKLLTMMAILFVSLTVIAQEMPAAQKNLMQFVGNWKSTDIKMTMGDKTYGGEFVVECVAVNGNTGIRASEKFTNDELGTIQAEDLFGYDPNLQQVHMYTIDNMGTTHDHVGYWIDDHHLFLEYQGVVEGKMYVEQLDMVIANANTMNFKLTGMLNGETVQTAIGTYKK